MHINDVHYRTVWMEESVIKMINQPLLPHRFEIAELKSVEETARAISTMVVRGAPAIGATGAYGMAQAVMLAPEKDWKPVVEQAAQTLSATRPTAQDLFHGIKRVKTALDQILDWYDACRIAKETAEAYAYASIKACEQIGEYGSEFIEGGSRILTHCNAGWLATVDWGTALSPVYKAKREGKKVFVLADETRPRCQGARLTAFELAGEKIPHAIIADNAAGYYMAQGEVDLVIVGTDRVARNGDVANKIGTYEKAVLARRHNIPFYVAAPSSTIDFDCPTGDDIPIEERHEDEVLQMWGKAEDGEVRPVRIAPEASPAWNPAFDVTPAELVTAFITEKGIIMPEELENYETDLTS